MKKDLKNKSKIDHNIYNIISASVMSVEGVSTLSSKFNESWTKTFINPANIKNCIKISGENNKEGMTVDIYIIVHNEFKIPDIAWNVQREVKKTLNDLKFVVKSINVHVQGIDFKI